MSFTHVRLFCLLFALSLATQAASITASGRLTINSYSAPSGPGIWTVNITLGPAGSPCPPSSSGCEGNLFFADGGDVLGAGNRVIRLSILNATLDPLESALVSIPGAPFSVGIPPPSSSHFGSFILGGFNYIYFRKDASPTGRLVQPGETLVLEFALTSSIPASGFRLGIGSNSTAIPEPSTSSQLVLAAMSLTLAVLRGRQKQPQNSTR